MNVLLRLDEVMLKGNNQSSFVDRLLQNIRTLFPGTRARRVSCGVYIENALPAALAEFRLIPGVAKVAPAVFVEPTLEQMKVGLGELLAGTESKTFRLTCSRSDKSFPLNSLQIVRELGAWVAEKYAWKVNLKNFDLEIEIFIGREGVALAVKAEAGVGGLPTGSSGKVVSLLSGGIDSPVASYSMMKRGAEVILVHIQNQTTVTEAVSQKIIGHRPRFTRRVLPPATQLESVSCAFRPLRRGRGHGTKDYRCSKKSNLKLARARPLPPHAKRLLTLPKALPAEA